MSYYKDPGYDLSITMGGEGELFWSTWPFFVSSEKISLLFCHGKPCKHSGLSKAKLSCLWQPLKDSHNPTPCIYMKTQKLNCLWQLLKEKPQPHIMHLHVNPKDMVSHKSCSSNLRPKTMPKRYASYKCVYMLHQSFWENGHSNNHSVP